MKTKAVFSLAVLVSAGVVFCNPQAAETPTRDGAAGAIGGVRTSAFDNNQNADIPGTSGAVGTQGTGTQSTQNGALSSTANGAQESAQPGTQGAQSNGVQNGEATGGSVPATQGSSSSQATAVKTTESSDDDDDELDESLADYMLKILKSFHNNSTANATHANDAAATGTQNGQSAPQNNAADKTPKRTTPISLHLPQLDDSEMTSASYDYYDSTPDWFEEDELTSTAEPFSRNGQANCNVEVDLTYYCIFDDLVEEYFEYDLTTKGFAGAIFDMSIINRLKRECKRGEWCLGDMLPMLTERAAGFYRGPFMDEDMWGCVLDVLEQRAGCNDKHYTFVVDAADFLYNLFPDGEPESRNEKNCFGHALAALHVTYADFLSQNMSDDKNTMSNLCDGDGYRMTKTYLCADSACESFFEPRETMEKFDHWQWFMENVNDVIQNCNLDEQCGKLGQGEGQSKTPDSWFGMSTTDWPESSTEFWYEWKSQEDGSHHAFSAPTSESDENMMVALMVASAVGVLFMVIGLIFWRRNRRRSNFYYRENGYGKVEL